MIGPAPFPCKWPVDIIASPNLHFMGVVSYFKKTVTLCFETSLCSALFYEKTLPLLENLYIYAKT